MDSDVRELREDIINLLRIAFRGGPYRVDMMNALDEMLKDLDRSAVRHLLSLLLTWLRDAFLLANGGSADLIVNKDVVSVLSKFSQAYASRDFPRAMSSVEDAIRALHGNAQIHITVLTTMLSLRRIFLSPQPVSTS